MAKARATKKGGGFDEDDPKADPTYAVNRKAHRIRQHMKLGKPVSDKLKAWLKEYDAKGAKAMADANDRADAAVDKASPAELAERAAEAADKDQGATSGGGLPTAPLPPEEPPAMPWPDDDPIAPPPAPRVRLADKPPSAGKSPMKVGTSSWRAKYPIVDASTGEQMDGREMACVYIASLCHGAAKQMCESIESAGVKPIVDHEQLRALYVLAMDDVLPAGFELTPAMIAAGSTSALLMQRFLRRKEIAAAQAKIKAGPTSRLEAIKAAEKPAPPLTIVRDAPKPPPTPAPARKVDETLSEAELAKRIAELESKRTPEAEPVRVKPTDPADPEGYF